MMKTLSKKWGRYILLFALLVITACERDDAIEEVNNDLRLETVSIEEAKEVLESSFIRTRNSEPSVIPELEKITQEALINSNKKLTVVPVKIVGDCGYSRILLIKLQDSIQKVIFTMYPQKNISESEGFTGKIIIRDMAKHFKKGFKVENGNIVAFLVRKKAFTRVSSNEESDSKSDETIILLEEVVCTAKGPPAHELKVAGVGSSGGSGVLDMSVYNPPHPSYMPDYSSWRYHTGRDNTNRGGGGSYTPPKPKVDDDNLEDTKADCIKEALEAGGSNSLLNKLLAGFKLENSPIDIIYKVQDKVFGKKGDEVNGLCRHNPNTNQITIFLSKTRMQTQSFELFYTKLFMRICMG